MTIIPERLAALDSIDLLRGGHSAGGQQFCFNEAAAWLAGEQHSDAPDCVSPVLRRYTMRLNDRWSDEQRQSLKPFLVRCIGTGSDGKDAGRQRIATKFLCTDLLEPWLRLAGMNERADSLDALASATPAEVRETLYAIRSEAWDLRAASRKKLEDRIRAEMTKQSKPVAAAVAAAAADAVAVAAAVAAADAAADAVAAADAAAAAAAAAAADAAADAAAAAAAAADGPQDYWSVYYRVRDYFRANPLPVMAKVHALNDEQAPLALVLLDRLIDADEVL